jgi:hypothetical protein
MFDYSACARHGEGDFQGSHSSKSAGFGDARGLFGILRPDYGDQSGGGDFFQDVYFRD